MYIHTPHTHFEEGKMNLYFTYSRYVVFGARKYFKFPMIINEKNWITNRNQFEDPTTTEKKPKQRRGNNNNNNRPAVFIQVKGA